MRRLGDVLPSVASELGLEEELRRARQMASWQRLVAELAPAVGADSHLLAIQPPALVVSATSTQVAQELRLRQRELLDAFERAPDGVRLVELRVVVRAGGRSA
jgi:predicted nucleic acid-binding Zn ribbon protein